MRRMSWARCLFAVVNVALLFGSQARGASKNVELPFSTLHRKALKLGNRPRHLWTYGEFTSWSPVQEGVFAAGFPKLLSYTLLQKIAPYVVFPTEPIVQIAICETEFPLPGLKQGRRFAITKEEPAEVLEMLQSNCFYARLRLSAPPQPLWKENAEKDSDPSTPPAGKEAGFSAERGERGNMGNRHPAKRAPAPPEQPLVLHFADIARAGKQRGRHPSQTWTYGRFFVDSEVENGLFIAHESGLPTRRVVEGLLASAAIFPFGERYDTAIFSSHLRHLRIEKKSVIEIDKSNPACVREIVPAGGLLVRLDLETEPEVEGRGGSHGTRDFFSPVVRLISP